MAERVLCIAIGQHLTRVAETDYKVASPRVHEVFSFETPEGMVGTDEHFVMESLPFRASLHEELKKRKIKTTKTIFVLDAGRIGNKEEEIAEMKEARLRDYIRTNQKTLFPNLKGEFQLAYRINGKGKQAGMQRVQMYAILPSVVEDFRKLSAFCGLSLVDLEIAENGLANLLLKWCPDEVAVSADVEEDHTSLTIVSGGQIAFQRSVPYGISDAVSDVAEAAGRTDDSSAVAAGAETSPALSFSEAYHRMKQNSYLLSSFDEKSDDALKKNVTEDLRYVIGNINRIVDYYISQNGNTNVAHIYVSGLGSTIAGFTELLSTETNIPVESLQKKIDNGIRGAIDSTAGSDYFAVMAASYKPIGIDVGKEKSASAVGSDALSSFSIETARKIFFACVAISAVLIAVPAILHGIYTVQQNRLNSQIAALSDAKQINDKYLAAKRKYDDLQTVENLTKTPTDQILPLLTELEAAIPTDTKLTDLNSDATGVSMTFLSATENSASQTMLAVRQFDSVDVESVDTLEAKTDDSGAVGGYQFTIYCTYASDEEEE